METILDYSDDGCGVWSCGSSDYVVDTRTFNPGLYGRLICFGVDEDYWGWSWEA